jgi:hypothetical protein
VTGVQFPVEAGICLTHHVQIDPRAYTASSSSLPYAFFSGIKRPEREADRSPRTGTELSRTPPYAFLSVPLGTGTSHRVPNNFSYVNWGTRGSRALHTALLPKRQSLLQVMYPVLTNKAHRPSNRGINIPAALEEKPIACLPGDVAGQIYKHTDHGGTSNPSWLWFSVLGVRLASHWTAAAFYGPIVRPRMSGWVKDFFFIFRTVEWWQGKTEELGGKSVPVPLRPPQTRHDETTIPRKSLKKNDRAVLMGNKKGWQSSKYENIRDDQDNSKKNVERTDHQR